MRPAFLQVVESAEGYEPATVALFALFIVMLAITAGLLLRDQLREPQPSPLDDAPWTGWSTVGASGPAVTETHLPPPIQPRPNPGDRSRGTPAWYRQAVSGHESDAVMGVRATAERLVEAANLGDLRLGFSLYTPEFLGRQQEAMGLDAGAFERLLRGKHQPASPRLAIDGIGEVTIDPPHRASARVSYATTDDEGRPPERIHFAYDDQNLVWLIDDIEIAPS